MPKAMRLVIGSFWKKTPHMQAKGDSVAKITAVTVGFIYLIPIFIMVIATRVAIIANQARPPHSDQVSSAGKGLPNMANSQPHIEAKRNCKQLKGNNSEVLEHLETAIMWAANKTALDRESKSP